MSWISNKQIMFSWSWMRPNQWRRISSITARSYFSVNFFSPKIFCRAPIFSDFEFPCLFESVVMTINTVWRVRKREELYENLRFQVYFFEMPKVSTTLISSNKIGWLWLLHFFFSASVTNFPFSPDLCNLLHLSDRNRWTYT